jgi:hypothetical protein
MQTSDVLRATFEHVRELVHDTVSGLDADALTWRPDPEANTIAWLIWHLTRIEDDHVAHIAGVDQVWTGDRWAERFGLEAGTMDHGYGHTPEQVAAVRPSGAGVLIDYHDRVAEQTLHYLDKVDADELDRVVDRSWDPPVTAGVRLVSVVGDTLQHVGQAAYARGLHERRS